MVGFRGWNRNGLEDHSSRGDTSKRLVTGSYLLNLNNDVLIDHTKYEAEDIDFSLRYVVLNTIRMSWKGTYGVNMCIINNFCIPK